MHNGTWDYGVPLRTFVLPPGFVHVQQTFVGGESLCRSFTTRAGERVTLTIAIYASANVRARK